MVACPEDRGVLPGWEIFGVAGFPGLQCVCVCVCECVCVCVCVCVRVYVGPSSQNLATSLTILPKEGHAFMQLGRNVLFDFAFYDSPHSAFIASSNLLEGNELMRTYFGLDQGRMVTLIMGAKTHLQTKDNNISAVGPLQIAEYLRDHINWSESRRVPSKETVSQLIQIGSMLQKAPRAKNIMSRAEVLWGRDTIFDETSKLLLLVQRTGNVRELCFVFEGLWPLLGLPAKLGSYAQPRRWLAPSVVGWCVIWVNCEGAAIDSFASYTFLGAVWHLSMMHPRRLSCGTPRVQPG